MCYFDSSTFDILFADASVCTAHWAELIWPQRWTGA